MVRALVLIAVSLTPSAVATDAELRGRQLYIDGKSTSGKEITAVLGRNGAEVSATVFSCSKCHGRDGRGRPEAGIFPPSVRWDDLTKPYRIQTESGRTRGSYNEALVVRAVTMGVDSSGHELNSTMPRFRLSRQDAADLVEYLKTLGTSNEAGVTDDTVRVGVLLPDEKRFAAAPVIARTIRAFFENLNRSGGVYGRKIDLHFAQAPAMPSAFAAALTKLVADERIFALLGTYIAGAEREADTWAMNSGVPIIGPYTLFTATGPPLNPYIFNLDLGIEGQVSALADYADKNAAGHTSGAALFLDVEPWRTLARSVVARHNAVNWTAYPVQTERSTLPEILAQTAKQASFILCLVPSPFSDAVLRAAYENPRNTLLLPAALAGEAGFALAQKDARVVLAVSSSPSDHTPEAIAWYYNLAESFHLPSEHLPAQFSALWSCRVFEEALTRSGRELNREQLLESLERLYQFATGFGPPVTFSRNRRVGATPRIVILAR